VAFAIDTGVMGLARAEAQNAADAAALAVYLLAARVLLVGVQPDAALPAGPAEAAPSAAVMDGLYLLRRALGRATRGMW